MKESANLIIGAGISGLTLANRFRFHGEGVIVLEKSRGVGGRMATRRDGEVTYDHGAQFYTPREGFLWDSLWTCGGLVESWFEEDGIPRKVSRGGMTKLAKSLLPPSHLRLNARAIGIAQLGEGWRVTTEDLQSFDTNRLFLTCPLPQSLDLLQASHLDFPASLRGIRYAKALVGLFEIARPIRDLTGIKYLENVSEDIFSISNQLSKGLTSALAFSVVMQPSWSEIWFDQPPHLILAAMQSAFDREWRARTHSYEKFAICKADLKKWRYSHPIEIFHEPYAQIGPNLFLLGDAFGGPSIGGACFSALSVFEAISARR